MKEFIMIQLIKSYLTDIELFNLLFTNKLLFKFYKKIFYINKNATKLSSIIKKKIF